MLQVNNRFVEIVRWEDAKADRYIADELTPFVGLHTKNIEFVRVSQKSVVCVLTLNNGFVVHGESATIDPSRFDWRIGCKYSLHTAVDKASGHVAYAEQEKQHKGEAFERDTPAPFPGHIEAKCE